MMTGWKRSQGFTIVETLIVLAVSSLLATSAMLMVSGRQNKTEFQVASNGLKQKLEQIINETRNGYYPTNNDFTCDGDGQSVLIKKVAVGEGAQGTNNTCIFLGKAIAFATDTETDRSERYTVYPLVAKRFKAGAEVTSFADAKPIALESSNRVGAHYATSYRTQNGLSFKNAHYKVKGAAGYTPNPAKSYAVIALADQLGQYTADVSGNLSSAVQKLSLYDYDLQDANGWSTSASPESSINTLNLINQGIDESRDIESIQLCYLSGGTDQVAQYTITGLGQLTVDMEIKAGDKCWD